MSPPLTGRMASRTVRRNDLIVRLRSDRRILRQTLTAALKVISRDPRLGALERKVRAALTATMEPEPSEVPE